MAMVAGLGRCLEHARTQTLTRHFHQAKAGNPADLYTRTVGLETILEPLLNSRVVLALIHVDEVDDDQARKVTQAQLARNFFGCLKVGFERGFLDRALFRGPARVHVNRHQSFGHANDDIAARSQLDRRVEHRAQIAFHLIAREKRQRVGILLHVFGVGRHDHFHEVLGDAIAALALDQNLVDILVVEVTDRAFDQVAFFIDLDRRDGFQRQVADLFPQALQVFIVALDFGLCTLSTRRADDQASTLRHLQRPCDFFQFLAVGSIGDLAADAAATRGVGHKHTIPACQ